MSEIKYMHYNINTNSRILVIGDIMVDHYIYGDCNRISPEAPVPIVDVKSEQYTLGGAGNVLKNLAAFNCLSNIVAVVGCDNNAQIVIDQLLATGVDGKGIINDDTRCTTVKSRVLVSNHQLIRLDRENTAPVNDKITQQLLQIIKAEIKSYDMVLLSDYNKGLLSPGLLSQIFAICRQAGIKTIVDPKGADFSKYKGVNTIKPNKREAIIASGIAITDRDSLRNACLKIKEVTECDNVIITMSEEGIAFFTNNELHVIPTKALDVVDVTGAGDTVLASLGLALAAGNSLHDACDFANHAAAVVVSKVGSATATIDEIKRGI